MERFGDVFVCSSCDKRVCDDTFSCKMGNNGDAFVSGVLDGVQIVDQGKKSQILVCICGEYIGEFYPYKKSWKYCFDLDKIRRCTLRNCEHSEPEKNLSPAKSTVPAMSEIADTAENEKTDDVSKKLHKTFTADNDVTEIKNDVIQLKKTIASLEERVKLMETENTEKLKYICGMLLSHKWEILRLQEIVWALHPTVNLDPAFSVDDTMFLQGSNDPNASLGLDADED